MKKLPTKLRLLGALAALSCASASAWADNCDNARNAFDEFYCKDKVYQQVDKDLNAAYADLSNRLKPADRKILKSVQLDWMAKRDDRCIKQDDGELILYVNCRLNMTRDQARFLNDRVQECKSTGCQPSRLRGE